VDDNELAEQLLTAVTRIRRALDARLQQHGASVARKRVLGALVDGPARQSTLAVAFSVTPRTVTELVDGLERDGLVKRRDDPSDRRAKLVFLTDPGRRVNELAMAARRDTIAEIFAGLSGSQRDVLGQTLSSINDHVTAITAATDDAPDAALLPTFTGD
jgi:DNA-binding MarR family transcriptional regulator